VTPDQDFNVTVVFKTTFQKQCKIEP